MVCALFPLRVFFLSFCHSRLSLCLSLSLFSFFLSHSNTHKHTHTHLSKKHTLSLPLSSHLLNAYPLFFWLCRSVPLIHTMHRKQEKMKTTGSGIKVLPEYCCLFQSIPSLVRHTHVFSHSKRHLLFLVWCTVRTQNTSHRSNKAKNKINLFASVCNFFVSYLPFPSPFISLVFYRREITTADQRNTLRKFPFNLFLTLAYFIP